jgi:hypothetical protein
MVLIGGAEKRAEMSTVYRERHHKAHLCVKKTDNIKMVLAEIHSDGENKCI